MAMAIAIAMPIANRFFFFVFFFFFRHRSHTRAIVKCLLYAYKKLTKLPSCIPQWSCRCRYNQKDRA
jgi:hypothetical protein